MTRSRVAPRAVTALLVAVLTAIPPVPGSAQPADACQGRTSRGEWTAVEPPERTATDTADLRLVQADPADADLVVVATEAGVHRTTDGGCTWETARTDLLPGAVVQAAAVAPGTGTVLLRVQEAPFLPHRIHRSTDGGATFDAGPLLSTPGRAEGLHISAVDPDLVYTLSIGTLGVGSVVEVSTDGGATFGPAGEIPDSGATGIRELRLVPDPVDADTVWIKDSIIPSVSFRSTDRGRTFEQVPMPVTPDEGVSYGDDGISLTPAPGGGARVVVFEEYDDRSQATAEALRYVSDDGGATFAIETIPTAPYTVQDHVVGSDPDIELVAARHFYPGTVPGTKVLRRDGAQGWVDVSLPELGHVEQLQRSVDPATGRTVAWGLGQDVLWRYDGPLDRPADGEVAVRRLSGDERIATGVAVSRDGFTADGSAAAAVLARADAFPDALTGSPLAVAGGGPLLLTAADRLSEATAAELQRVLPPDAPVRLLGGPAALSEQVAADVAALGFAVERVEGPSRFETAVGIARTARPAPTVILLADGTTFPDALVAGAAAAGAGGVAVLTAGDQPHPATQAYLAGHPDVPVIAVGAVAQAAHPGVQGLGGADPMATAVAVARRFTGASDRIALASAAAFPDGLTGGAHAGRAGMPLLLTPPDRLEPVTAGHLRLLPGLREVVVYGGPVAVSDAVAEAARTRGG